MATIPSPSPTLSGPARLFRSVAFVEALTFLVLLGATVLYRVLDGPDFVSFMGPVHGIAFLVYLVLVLQIRDEQGWSLGRTLIVILVAAVPLGGFWAGRHLNAARGDATS